MGKKFKPFERVIVKSRTDDYWACDLYSHLNEDTGSHETINRIDLFDSEILSYEGNEHLVGTSDEPETEVRLEEGEFLMGCCEIELVHPQYWTISKYVKSLHKDCFLTDCGSYIYAVKFSDFNPNDMEATKAKILCVKNGKIIRYKD